MKTRPKFLLIAPWDYQLYVVLQKNLTHLGYDVTVIHNNQYRSSLKDALLKIRHWARKVSGKYSRRELTDRYTQEKRQSLLNTHSEYDLCLVLRPDLFAGDLLEGAKKRSKTFISFFYDGLRLNPQVLPLIDRFDRFFIFDRTELSQYPNVRYAPNFYFDYPELDQPTHTAGPEIYYISSFHPSRMEAIESFHRFITSRISTVRFDLVCQPGDEAQLSVYAREHFQLLHHIVPYEDQLKLIRSAGIILDFRMDAHFGFSFRIFDGIKLGKKVITTNALVVSEDFYHPDNFFVLTPTNEAELDDFLQRPYIPLAEEIRTKYSLESWLKRVSEV